MKRSDLWGVVGTVVVAAGLLNGTARAVEPADPRDWPMYQHDIRRSGFNANETKINRSSVALLAPKWIFHADNAITASPVVAHFQDFDHETEGAQPRKVVFVGSADENFYAVDAADGSLAWDQPFKADPAPGLAYNMFVSSGFIDKERGVVYVAGGYTMYALDLYDGHVHWRFTTAWGNASDGDGPGHGCASPGAWYGGGEIETSPVMVDGIIYFGSDGDGWDPCTAAANRFPAIFAIDADDGELQWFWRPHEPEPNDSQRRTCGDVWASIAVDPLEGLLYSVTSDCTRGEQKLYNEAIIALPIAPAEGSVNAATKKRTEPANWYYQPRLFDPYDYDFGSTPLLFDANGKKYLGVGGKDGIYYVVERQRAAQPDTFRHASSPAGWQTRVVRGGFAGGFIGSTATDGTRIFGATALFDTPTDSQSTVITPNPLVQPPFAHSFDAVTGDILWQQLVPGPTFAATTAVPGVVFVGSTAGTFSALDAETGQVLWTTVGIGAISSGAAISDGEVFVGGGTTAESYGLGQGPLNALHA
ncbi:MAG: PQQ-binding-like beta-propeller repeat protein, partial [Candidatus Binatia bacterium]